MGIKSLRLSIKHVEFCRLESFGEALTYQGKLLSSNYNMKRALESGMFCMQPICYYENVIFVCCNKTPLHLFLEYMAMLNIYF